MDDRDAGILYMGNGRMLVSWFTHSAHFYESYYRESIGKRASDGERPATLGMLDGYAFLPEEERVGGSYVRMSDDYGVTWSETVRVPVSAPHGPTMCRDGSLIYLGSVMYEDKINPSIDERKIALYRSTEAIKKRVLGRLPRVRKHRKPQEKSIAILKKDLSAPTL